MPFAGAELLNARLNVAARLNELRQEIPESFAIGFLPETWGGAVYPYDACVSARILFILGKYGKGATL